MRKPGVIALALVLFLCALASPASGLGLEVQVLDCGTMSGMDAAAFLPDMAEDERPARLDMVNRCFLIVHPKGTLLWDAGLPGGWMISAMSWVYWLTSFMNTSIALPELQLIDQLHAFGLSTTDIDYVAFSHSHFDHVGQAADFTKATWLVQKAEYDWIFDPELDNDAVQFGLIEPMKDAKKILLKGDHDVFGDGTVVILSAPGHTPGHQCLFLDLPETGPIVLSGDLYHSLLNRERREPPDFNTDRGQTRKSMERIENFLKQRGATLWIQHAPESGLLAPAQAR